MTKRIGIINSGGDCPGLNTVIDSVVQSLSPEYEIIGFYRGFEGLHENNYTILDPSYTSLIKFQGGTFLKSVNKGNFAGKTGSGEINNIDPILLESAAKNYSDLGLEAMVVLGGDGSMATASQFLPYGVNIIGIPKSIDNDLSGTDFTFGFNTAVEITTEALDRISTSAKSHDRIMILEVMGRHSGWIALYSGLAGGADMILMPEIPFKHDLVVDFFKQKYAKGQTNGLIVISEGAKDESGKEQYKDLGTKSSEMKLGGIGEHIEVLLNFEPELESRCTVLGHLQRGGTPNSWDRILSRSYGAYAGRMVREKKYGQMVGYVNGNFTSSSIEDCLKDLKLVNPNGDFVQRARELGVSFGDR